MKMPTCLRLLIGFYGPLRTASRLKRIQQRYSIPEKESEERELARRVGYQHTPACDALDAFRKDYRAHTERVRAIFQKIYHDLN